MHPFRFRVVLVLALLAASPAAAQEVMSAVHADHWAAAEAAADRLADPVPAKLVTYFRLLAPGASAPGEIADFMASSPDWPMQPALARKRDEAIAADPDDTGAAAECDRPKPFTVTAPAALQRCAEAYANLGRSADGAAMARRAWIAGISDQAAETAFLQRWSAAIGPAEQWARFDHQAWTDSPAAKRQAARLDPADRPKAEARLALQADDPNAPALVAALPEAQRQDAALVLEQAKFLRRAGQDENALKLWTGQGFAAEPKAPDHLAAFWAERNLLARHRLRDGDAPGAYALADDTAQTGAARLDASFLAGFIALRKLQAPDKALAHFRALAGESQAAITQGRAHFWIARALASQGDDKAAHAEYAQAAAWPSTFYGQLAALALGEQPAARILATKDPAPDPQRALDFAGRELARGAAWLVSWGEPHRAQWFLLRLDDVLPDPADRTLAARLALGFGMPETAVALARRAGIHGEMLLQAGWPVAADIPRDAGLDPALALGIIRQESSFDPATVSPAGARGLMQLMPGTAKPLAHRLGLVVSVAALTVDSHANIRLGTAYLRGLLDKFDNSIPLAVAAYNAGPNRVQEWLASNGDPRADADAIDWIEQIPFGETRNYVQRVIENQVIYRARLGEKEPHPLAKWMR